MLFRLFLAGRRTRLYEAEGMTLEFGRMDRGVSSSC